MSAKCGVCLVANNNLNLEVQRLSARQELQRNKEIEIKERLTLFTEHFNNSGTAIAKVILL